jgi:hypothetical protein
LYEAKMIHLYTNRHGSFADAEPGQRIHKLPEIQSARLRDPALLVEPFYWVPEAEVNSRLAEKGWPRGWLMGWRDVTDARASERTIVAAAIPRAGCGDKFLLMMANAPAPMCAALLGNLCSLPLDYVARQKVGGIALKYFTMKQLPVLPPTAYQQTDMDFIVPRVLELSYTSVDMEGEHPSYGTTTAD